MDFPLPVGSDSIPSASVGLLDPENRGVAVGISVLSRLEPEILLGYICTPFRTTTSYFSREMKKILLYYKVIYSNLFYDFGVHKSSGHP